MDSTEIDIDQIKTYLETQFDLGNDKELILNESLKEFTHHFLMQSKTPRAVPQQEAPEKKAKTSLLDFIENAPVVKRPERKVNPARGIDFSECSTLEKLHLSIHELPLFRPESNHLQIINGRGNHPNPPLMIVGYAPDEEDLRLKNLFTGERGKLLGSMLEKVLKVQKQMCYMSSFYRTKPYRPLSNDERRHLDKALLREMELVNPKAVLFMGRELGPLVFNDPRPVEELKSEEMSYGGRPAFITFSTRELIENPPLRHMTVPLLNLLRQKIL